MDSEKFFLLLVVGVLAAVTWLMVSPFLPYILFAVILAFVLHPLHKRLSPITGARISALTLVVFGLLAAILPFAVATGAIIQDARDLAEDANQTEFLNITEMEQRIQDVAGVEIDIEASANSAINQFTEATFGSFSRVLNLVTNVTIGVTLMLFLLYYFLKSGESMVTWFKGILPLRSEIQEVLLRRIDNTTWAVIKGHVLVSVVQGLVAGVGLAIVGIPNYIFWTFVMILLGFIPIVGAMMVWIPASAYLFLIDRVEAGVFLLLYGLIIVSLPDNILRPIVVDRGAELNPAVILIGVIGGLVLFGAAGLFFGPIILGVFKSVLTVIKNNYTWAE